jgi:hypothetical protein
MTEQGDDILRCDNKRYDSITLLATRPLLIKEIKC